MDAESFAKWLKGAREAKGISAEQVAQALGVSVQSVHNWERSAKPIRPDARKYPGIDRAYGLPAGAIFAALGEPLGGPSLDYWRVQVERLGQQIEDALASQRQLVAQMREASGAETATPPAAQPKKPERLSSIVPKDSPTTRALAEKAAATVARQRAKDAQDAGTGTPRSRRERE